MMNKTAFKIFICFSAISVAIATILLCVNFLGFAIIGSDGDDAMSRRSVKKTLERVSGELAEGPDGYVLEDEKMIPSDCWCILIDAGGDIVWSHNQPDDIPVHYTLNDIARLTRWFLEDYPVYVRTDDAGLFVLGLPKNAVGKYEVEYSMEWFHALPRRLMGILVLNLCFAFILACLIGSFFYSRIYALSKGIGDLRQEKCVKLKVNGIFKELARNINETSMAIQRKNAVLSVRERARVNWISGISHDIRTPLSVIIGNSQMLEQSPRLPDEQKRSAAVITAQALRIKKLVADLNLMSSLEDEMQPGDRKTVCMLCPLIRETVADLMNSGLSGSYEIELDLRDGKMAVRADASLLERALFNLLNNSIAHNKNGCKITVSAYKKGGNAHIVIADNGCGVGQDVIDHIAQMPNATHGLGLPMAYKIIAVHGGHMTVKNDGGCRVEITLPVSDG